MTNKFIAIEGNIGAGKTTLATMLAHDWDARLMLEQFAENPFLPLFYENPEKNAFPLELSFLGERFEQLKNTLVTTDLFNPLVISDYYILKSLLFAKVNLGEAEYNLFHKLFHLISDSFPKPDVLVYLNTPISSLQQNIRKRGRAYEQNIKNDYLENLHHQYIDAFKEEAKIPVLLLNMVDKDFVKDPEVYKQVKFHLAKDYQSGLHIIDF
jgi:deoxyadenosine/deoxycytidine kinase